MATLYGQRGFLKDLNQKVNSRIRRESVYTLDTKTHRLKLEFRISYVNDSLEWIDTKNKKSGHILIDGVKGFEMEIDSSKKVIPADTED